MNDLDRIADEIAEAAAHRDAASHRPLTLRRDRPPVYCFPMPDLPKYDHREIERRWQTRWREIGLFEARDDEPSRRKLYVLMMFPYPSGDRLHVGHGRNYIIGDVVVRTQLMRGRNVLSPMGFDAFGLPAENYALKHGVNPWVSTRRAIDSMKVQFDAWGCGYDWDREVRSCDPAYYKWTQWLFLKLLSRGLAYRKEAPVNWCPSCATVLANEQVEADGTCERCDSRVEKKNLTQWFFKITSYADRLIDNLSRLGTWPEKVKLMQRNWIGRSEGTRIDFTLEDGTPLPVFTTRPDTLFGVTYVSLAPEHPLVERATEPGAREAAARMRSQSFEERVAAETSKEGAFTGLHAVNPATGERVPVWVANYALMEYGTGAVMAVPGHDQRDFEFATKYGLPIKVVIRPFDRDLRAEGLAAAYVDPGVMVDSGPFQGVPSEEGKRRVTTWLAMRDVGSLETRYRLRDWLVSRQRYWGAPIPVVYCKGACEGAVPVPEEDLPVLLPHDRGLDVNVRPTGTGRSPLANVPEFVRARCPRCGAEAERDTDTLDTFVDSSWYFLRYASAKDGTQAFDGPRAAYWLPVDQYVGGAEHATKHLIYARFITMVLHDMELVPFEEPFTNLFSQGLICKRNAKGELLRMSKSRGNVVNPDELIAQYGADTERLYTLFIGPPERDVEWQEDGVVGAYRFLGRLWSLVHEARGKLPAAAPTPRAGDHLAELGLSARSGQLVFLPPAPTAPPSASPRGGEGELSAAGKELRRKTHETIAKVTRDVEGAFQFNTAIAAIMELVNQAKAIDLEKAGPDDLGALRAAIEAAVLLLAPMVPHVAEELWVALGHTDKESIFREAWPTFDPELAKRAEIEIAIQVNGKVRGREVVPRDAPEDELREVVMANPRVQCYLDGKQVVKTVIVPNKIVNIVVR